jgi:NAD(P)-dependent dehydrogenase (short-subunit alcohol dehydrogenase family)
VVVDKAVRTLDGTDLLVNNVGSSSVRTFDQVADDDWDKTMNPNLMSYVRITRASLPHLRASKNSPAIVNKASDLARQPETLPLDYAASKTAVLAFTKRIARGESPHIPVNAVDPGPIWTPFWTEPGGFAELLKLFTRWIRRQPWNTR